VEYHSIHLSPWLATSSTIGNCCCEIKTAVDDNIKERADSGHSLEFMTVDFVFTPLWDQASMVVRIMGLSCMLQSN
jgi:hypothetical protein